jgi:hypothetical protein
MHHIAVAVKTAPNGPNLAHNKEQKKRGTKAAKRYFRHKKL